MKEPKEVKGMNGFHVSDVEDVTGVVVYFLISGDEVVYVGQSKRLRMRVYSHCRDKDFDSVAYCHVYDGKPNNLEALYIAKYNPKYNATLPPNDYWLSSGILKTEASRRLNAVIDDFFDRSPDCFITRSETGRVHAKYIKADKLSDAMDAIFSAIADTDLDKWILGEQEENASLDNGE